MVHEFIAWRMEELSFCDSDSQPRVFGGRRSEQSSGDREVILRKDTNTMTLLKRYNTHDGQANSSNSLANSSVCILPRWYLPADRRIV